MRRSLVTMCGVVCVVVGLTAIASMQGKDLAVTVSYTGKGPVDETHEIWVFLFDSPNINEKSQPIAVQAVRKSGGTATFKSVALETVYVAFAYDETGKYDGTAGPPPPGTPVGMHSTDGKGPSPVKPGQGVKIKATFDESRRMGQGRGQTSMF